MKNSLQHFLLWLFVAIAGTVTAQVTPGIDCATAGEITSLDSFTIAQVNVQSSGFMPSCFSEPATNSGWYKFTVGTGGALRWKCNPVIPASELDWAFYDITNGCGTGQRQNITCNYNYDSIPSGTIGMEDGGSGELSPAVTLSSCHTYAIFIDNYSHNGSGLHFNFNGSAFTIDTTRISFSLLQTNFCSDTAIVYITNTSNAGQNLTWNYGDGSTFAGPNPISHFYDSAGTYTISLSKSYCAGEGAVRSPAINIGPKHSAIQSVICAGDSFAYNGHLFSAPGNYTDTLFTTAGCDSIIRITLTQRQAPLYTITQPDPYSLQIFTGYTFSWIDCQNNSVVNTSDGKFTPGREGQFAALVYDGFCNYKTDCYSVLAPTGIADIENLTCALWPNPAGSELHVSLLNSSNNLTARITNLQGCQMGVPLKITSQNIQIPISTLPTGLYFLILETEQGSVVKKFAKE